METTRPRRQNIAIKYFEKLFLHQWTIGFFKGEIKDIIRSKSFDPDIEWLPIESFKRFFADPFFFGKINGNYYLLVEEFDMIKEYGKISLIVVDKAFKILEEKVLLDTKCHFSYPFVFKENDKVYIFPEAGDSGKLSCYEFDPHQRTLIFLKSIMDLPLIDPTILKYNNKYWLFGTLSGKDANRKLYIFYSDSLLGTYQSHPCNPVKDTLKGSRPAGNFIEVDKVLYRPSQNCERRYGESIIIDKINILDELNFSSEPYMSIRINKKNKTNRGIQTIHTINAYEDTIVVDGKKRKFYPFLKFKYRFVKYIKAHRKVQNNGL